jgi:hypothetical protein
VTLMVMLAQFIRAIPAPVLLWRIEDEFRTKRRPTYKTRCKTMDRPRVRNTLVLSSSFCGWWRRENRSSHIKKKSASSILPELREERNPELLKTVEDQFRSAFSARLEEEPESLMSSLMWREVRRYENCFEEYLNDGAVYLDGKNRRRSLMSDQEW